jgi:hypothetical protein
VTEELRTAEQLSDMLVAALGVSEISRRRCVWTPLSLVLLLSRCPSLQFSQSAGYISRPRAVNGAY